MKKYNINDNIVLVQTIREKNIWKRKLVMKKILESLKYIAIFIVTLCICMILMYLSCLIPSVKLLPNIERSILDINKSGSKKIIPVFNKEIMFDTYADAMMINMAYSVDSKHPFYSMLFARTNYVDGVTDTTVEDKAYEDKEIPIFPHVQELEKLLRGKNLIAIEYARYWHGHLIFLRPLLTIFSYTEIKIISYIFHFILFLMLLYKIKKKIGLKFIIAIIFGFIVTEGYLVYSCLEETIGFSLILIGSNVLLSINKKYYGKFFFILGMLTAFFDLLTIPVAILVFPLIILILMENNKSIKELTIACIKYITLFAISYALMWASKWIIVDLVYNRNLVKNAIGQALYRSSSKNIRLLSVELFNIVYIGLPVAIYVGIIYILNIIIAIFEKIKFRKVTDIIAKNLFLEFIGITPFIWYALIREHSLSHAYFTHRSLIVTCVCSQIIMINILSKYFKNNRKEIFTIFTLVDLIVIILNYIV